MCISTQGILLFLGRYRFNENGSLFNTTVRNQSMIPVQWNLLIEGICYDPTGFTCTLINPDKWQRNEILNGIRKPPFFLVRFSTSWGIGVYIHMKICNPPLPSHPQPFCYSRIIQVTSSDYQYIYGYLTLLTPLEWFYC